MTVGVVVVTWNGERYVEACLRSVFEQRALPRHVVVIDNSSADRTRELVAGFEREATAKGATLTVVQESTNTGFTRGANTGLRWLVDPERRLDVVVLLNQDAQIEPGWCAAVIEAFETDARVGAVGARILRPDGVTIQHAGGYLDWPRLVGRHRGDGQLSVPGELDTLVDVEFVTAAAMAIRADALRNVGYFNEVFSPGYYEDVDLCRRLRDSKWRVVYQPSAVARHVESASFSCEVDRLSLSHRNRLIYALPLLLEPQFRREFCQAEREAFTVAAPLEERRALARAYLSVLLRISEIAKVRLPVEQLTSGRVKELSGVFVQLREESVVTLASPPHNLTRPTGVRP